MVLYRRLFQFSARERGQVLAKYARKQRRLAFSVVRAFFRCTLV